MTDANAPDVEAELLELAVLVSNIPAVRVLSRSEGQAVWWIKLVIDIHDPLAWRVVQELGHLLNFISFDQRLPTRFYPVSPPPYMNGGPAEFLAWIIAAAKPDVPPRTIQAVLEGRLPRPVTSTEAWELDD
jgi:hypothetical protein